MRLMTAWLLTAFFGVAVAGCSPESRQDTAPVQKAMDLSLAEREKIQRFVQELYPVVELPDKTLALISKELMALVAGEWSSARLTGLVATARSEVLAMTGRLASLPVPAGISTDVRQQLENVKEGLVKAGQLKSEALDAVKRSIEEKKPTILLEFRSKLAEVSKQLDDVRQELKKIQNDTGITI